MNKYNTYIIFCNNYNCKNKGCKRLKPVNLLQLIDAKLSTQDFKDCKYWEE